jgi:hypothetical protein
MPLHDWTDERGWDSVHPIWMTYLIEWIRPRLPAGYRAFLGGLPALTVASSVGRPDVGVRSWDSLKPSQEAERSTAVIEPDQELQVSIRLDPQRAIHVDRQGQLVAAIELVSPRNKDRSDAKETYTNRYVGYLRLGVHLLLVDVLPRPRSFSFADSISSCLNTELSALPPPFAVAYRVGEVIPVGDEMGSLLGVWRRSLQVGERLPILPLPLSVHESISIDLEETYQRAAEQAYLT